MIYARRTLAVFMTLALMAALSSTLLIYRANRTVLNADFYTDQFAAIGAFDAVHDEVLPTALNDFLAEQESKLPDNLADVELPTDTASQQLILDFARTTLPPEYLESVATEGIQAFIAYLTGQRSDLDWALSFNQPIEDAFGSIGRSPSAFEQTWSELELTRQAFEGLSAAIELPELQAFQNEQAIQMLALFRGAGLDLETSSEFAARLYEAAPEGAAIPELTTRILAGGGSEADLELLQGFLAVEGVPAAQATSVVSTMASEGAPSGINSLSLMLGEDEAVAIEWFQGELFAAVRELTAYLSGASDRFAIHIDFSAHPEIAEFAAGPLNKTPQELKNEGYRLNSEEINVQLAGADNPPVDSLEDARAWFTPAGRMLGIDDIRNLGSDEPATPITDGSIDTTEAGAFALDTARGIIGPVSSRGLLIGVFGVLLLAFQIGMTGGRQWWSRAVWGASALAAAAFAIVAIAGPVYRALLAPQLARAIEESKDKLITSGNPAATLGLRALDQLETVINQQVGAIAINALAVGIVALLVAASAIGVHVYLERRDATREAAPDPIVLDENTPEERLAA